MVSQNNLVSIIIPVYNVSDYIERCIKSVMNQTYSDIECIIVDDATPDDSIEKCEQMIAAYDGPIQFSILHHQVNRGLSAARNTGTDAAIGEFIYYLDSDDNISEDCIEKLMKPVELDNSIDMVQGNHVMLWNGQQLVFYNRDSPISLQNKDVLEHCLKKHNIFGSAWNKLIRRSFLEEYHIYFKEGLVFEDLLWFFYVQKYTDKIYICKDVTYYYYERSNSIITSGNKIVHGNSYQTIYNDILLHLTSGKESKELNGYVLRFSKAYCEYCDLVPAFRDTYRLYQKNARKYGCWKVLACLCAIGVIRKLGIPKGVLRRINIIRWKFIEWYDCKILGHKDEGVNCNCML